MTRVAVAIVGLLALAAIACIPHRAEPDGRTTNPLCETGARCQ